ncbi:FecR family protein [Bacteroides sp. 519]|uniref:FecR family protein n=1 Tax=Bacteroides sp. 519 TaxID=2302937 RepID=UPI0013D66D1B|nr:FecR family protein [Bacteroides sp. 519]
MSNTKNIPWDNILSAFKGNIKPEKEQELSNWLQLPANKALYNELLELWETIRAEASSHNVDTAFYEQQLWNRINARKKKADSRKRYMYIGIAAAILLAFNVITLSVINKKSAGTPVAFIQKYESMEGKSRLVLPDSTIVWLNKDAHLTFLSDYGVTHRNVSLQGEGYFEVYHNTEKPFIVQTDAVNVKVYGTKFNMKTNNEAGISVSLLEGAVELIAGKESIKLLPGQQGVYNTSGKSFIVENSDPHLESLWTKDQLKFSQQPITQICKYLSQWYNVDIELENNIKEKNYSCTFTVRNESLDEILLSLSNIHPIKYTFTNNKVLIY